jgi:RND family efflux transporter MFP subunit
VLRQIVLSLLVALVAAVLVVIFVPGARDTLAHYGVTLPFGAETANAAVSGAPAAAGTRPTGAPAGGQGGGGYGGGRGGSRTAVVLTAPATLATIDDKLTALGEGTALRSVTVISPAAGTLTELLVNPGDQVAAGAVIGKLDDSAERIALERAKLAQTDADATLTRTQNLANSSGATAVALSTAQLAADNARLAVATAQLDLDKRTITTPIAGTVGLFQVSAGNSLTTQSVVTTIEDNSELRINFYVPERYASAIALGAAVDASAVALPGVPLAGKVTAIDNKVDPTSRTLGVEARIPNADGRLRPGMSFSVAMAFPGEQFPAVDPLAVQWSSTGSYVWKLTDGKVTRVDVAVIQRNSDGVLVKGPLTAGDPVVVQGVQQLAEGMAVRLLDAPADGAAAPAGAAPAGAAPAGAAPAAGTSEAPAAGTTPPEGKKKWNGKKHDGSGTAPAAGAGAAASGSNG